MKRIALEEQLFRVVLLTCASLALFSTTGGNTALITGSHQLASTTKDSVAGYQSKKAAVRKQTTFSAEEPLQHPIDVPTDVLQLLRRDVRNQTCLGEGQSPKDVPASWFVASDISLKDGHFGDLIVMPANPCLKGANVVPFWIFRRKSGQHLLSLSATAFALEILKTRTNSYRDIRVTSLSATTEYTTVYKFDGNRYKRRQHSQKAIRP